MIQLVFFLSVGVLLFVFLLVLARRGRAEGAAETLVEARHALLILQTELLPRALVTRIFAREDLDFVVAQGSRQVEDLFLRERTRVALIWVERVRGQVELLRRLHLGSARYYAQLELRRELSLAWDFGVLLVCCRALSLVFLVGGAYSGSRIVGTVAEAATRICEISGQSLAFLSKSGVDDFAGRGSTL